MGGPGSGNFNHAHRPPKRPLVEHALRLRASLLRRHGLLREPGQLSGAVTFGDGSIIRLDTLVAPSAAAVRLAYTVGRDLPEPVDELVRLIPTRPRPGGVRWWFACPGCGRRVGVLYRPVGGRFRCRACHGLTYSSRQNGHRHHTFAASELGRAMQPLLNLIDAAVRRSR